MSAPGWYPDPAGSGQQRYFDGTNWGPTAPPPTAPPAFAAVQAEPSQARFTIHYGFALLAIFSAFGTLLPSLSWILGEEANNPDDDFLVTIGVLWLLWGGMWTIIWTAFAIQHTLRGRRR